MSTGWVTQNVVDLSKKHLTSQDWTIAPCPACGKKNSELCADTRGKFFVMCATKSGCGMTSGHVTDTAEESVTRWNWRACTICGGVHNHWHAEDHVRIYHPSRAGAEETVDLLPTGTPTREEVEAAFKILADENGHFRNLAFTERLELFRAVASLKRKRRRKK